MVFRFLNRAPFNGAGAAPSPRPIARGASSREAALQREVDALRAQQAALARQERTAAANLARMQDSLDALSNEIDRRAKTTRDVELQTRGERMIAGVKAFFAKQDGCDIKPATVTAAIKIALGLERPLFAAVPPSPAAAAESHRASAQQIVDAGNPARGSTVSSTPGPHAAPMGLGRVKTQTRFRKVEFPSRIRFHTA
jgi:hypothetical protein